MEVSEIYEPLEDSDLMKEMVFRHAKGNVLDMGTGSGIQALAAFTKRNVNKIVGVDISRKALNECKKQNKRITWIQSNLFNKLGKKYYKFFDTIIFNPPYLPKKSKIRMPTIEGGERGYEIILEFLKSAKDYLKPDGIILLLFSSLSKPDVILDFADKEFYKYKLLRIKSLFFEELFVYKLEKADIFNELEKKGVKNIKFFAKGWRGMIHSGRLKSKKVAIKTKRKYSEAKNAIKKETKWLKIVNKHKIGPEFLFADKGFLVYKFIEGKTFRDWMEKAPKTKLKKVILNIFDQCFKLDQLKINKEEMHRPLTNVLIKKDAVPVLIDFERTYKTKKPHNVTQFCQFLINRMTLFRKKKFTFTRDKIIKVAVNYKQDKEYFPKIKQLIK